MPSDKDREIRCSFCGKTQDEVVRLVEGPGVYICDTRSGFGGDTGTFYPLLNAIFFQDFIDFGGSFFCSDDSGFAVMTRFDLLYGLSYTCITDGIFQLCMTDYFSGTSVTAWINSG